MHLALLLIWWINAQIPLLKSAAFQDFNRYFLIWMGFTLTYVHAAFVLAFLVYKKHDLELKSLSQVCMPPLFWQCCYIKSMTLNWNHYHNSPCFFLILTLDLGMFWFWGHFLVTFVKLTCFCVEKRSSKFCFILSLFFVVELPSRQTSFKIKFHCRQK